MSLIFFMAALSQSYMTHKFNINTKEVVKRSYMLLHFLNTKYVHPCLSMFEIIGLNYKKLFVSRNLI